jgi:heme exporter protein C
MTAPVEQRTPDQHPAPAGAAPARTQTVQTISWLLAIASVSSLAAVAVLGLFVTGPDEVQGEVVRILYIHPATAWIAYLAFGVTSLTGLLWLIPRTRKPLWDRMAAASAEIGVLFTGITLLLGAIWGRATWGVWWAWDARVTSTLLLFLLYAGVVALRQVPAGFDARARRTAIGALIAFLNVPLVHFSVKWWKTLHQEASVIQPSGVQLHGLQLFTLIFSVFSFMFVYAWLMIQRTRLARWEDQLGSGGLDAAIEARRAEAGRDGKDLVGSRP